MRWLTIGLLVFGTTHCGDAPSPDKANDDSDEVESDDATTPTSGERNSTSIPAPEIDSRFAPFYVGEWRFVAIPEEAGADLLEYEQSERTVVVTELPSGNVVVEGLVPCALHLEPGEKTIERASCTVERGRTVITSTVAGSWALAGSRLTLELVGTRVSVKDSEESAMAIEARFESTRIEHEDPRSTCDRAATIVELRCGVMATGSEGSEAGACDDAEARDVAQCVVDHPTEFCEVLDDPTTSNGYTYCVSQV